MGPLLIADLANKALSQVGNVAQYVLAKKAIKKDKAELARLNQPFYKIQQEYLDNYNQSAYNAQSGFTQASEDTFLDNADRGLSTSLDAITETGGGANDIASIFNSYSDNVRNFAAEDSEKQLNNIRYFQSTAKDLAGQKTTQWALNEFQPYQNKLKEITGRIAANKQNVNNSVQSFFGTNQAAVTSLQNDDLISKLFGDGKGSVDELPDGQKMWMDFKEQSERDNAAQGNYTLPDKFNTQRRQFRLPDDISADPELMQKLYQFLNRPR